MDIGLCAHHIPGGEMTAGYAIERTQANRGSAMLLAMFCWETTGPVFHVDATYTRTTCKHSLLPLLW